MRLTWARATGAVCSTSRAAARAEVRRSSWATTRAMTPRRTASAASKGRAVNSRSRATATPTWAGSAAAYRASGMPRSSSGTRKVARSLATATSAIMAISRPPAWQMPLTAAITGARLSRMARNGRTSKPAASGTVSPSTDRPPRSPPGLKTSPVPVMMRAASPSSAFTSLTARLIP